MTGSTSCKCGYGGGKSKSRKSQAEWGRDDMMRGKRELWEY
jgi:hypothetical protein